MGRNKIVIKTISEPLKTIASLMFSLFCIAWSVWLIIQNKVWESIAVFILGSVYCAFFYSLYAFIIVDAYGIRQKRLFRSCKSIPWDAIKEVGLLGNDAFSVPHKRHFRFIYFSTRVLTQSDRFDLTLEWPTSKLIYIPYTSSNYFATANYGGKDIQSPPVQ